MEIFESCQKVNDFISEDDLDSARNELIMILDYHQEHNIEYTPIVNHLIRVTGLYPYMNLETASWQDRFVFDAFKVDVGTRNPVTLHREQSVLLKKLLDGEDVAVSAPTSFGKSFVIDAFISITSPNNVVIIVPTIALTDETRRRLYPKFAGQYKIITTPDVELEDRNIFIFPQERAINYLKKIEEVDILIIDEFYKASSEFDKERSPALVKALMEFSKIARQRYFLAPNISELIDNPFTEGMEFFPLNFNTVVLKQNEFYREIDGDIRIKNQKLVDILREHKEKTLIFAGSYPDIKRVSELVLEHEPKVERALLNQFAEWLSINYEDSWGLVNLIKRGAGVHNGSLHRSLSQIQVKLFEEVDGLHRMISTSSIIEGVNTSAENVILWRNRSGGKLIDHFTYKNILGRSGRMFKHFVGNAFILEKPPAIEATQLSLDFPDELVGDIDETKFEEELTREQQIKIIAFKEEMSDLVGRDTFNKFQRENAFQGTKSGLVKDIAQSIVNDRYGWRGLGHLNSDNTNDWKHYLFKVINIERGRWGVPYGNVVKFVQKLAGNWEKSIPELLDEMSTFNVGIDDFFTLERDVTFRLSSLLHNVNVIQKEVLTEYSIDISSFVAKTSHAFLPTVVYHLEEYGLPRMISKKIHQAGLINFLDDTLTVHSTLDTFRSLSCEQVIDVVADLDDFDRYIVTYFYEGILIPPQS